MLAPNPTNRLHCQHSPPPASNQSEQRIRPNGRGSILDADNPAQGVKIARRNTAVALEAVKVWPGKLGACRKVGAAANLDSSCARRRQRTGGSGRRNGL